MSPYHRDIYHNCAIYTHVLVQDIESPFGMCYAHNNSLEQVYHLDFKRFNLLPFKRSYL
jgi:hypothetical protein